MARGEGRLCCAATKTGSAAAAAAGMVLVVPEAGGLGAWSEGGVCGGEWPCEDAAADAISSRDSAAARSGALSWAGAAGGEACAATKSSGDGAFARSPLPALPVAGAVPDPASTKSPMVYKCEKWSGEPGSAGAVGRKEVPARPSPAEFCAPQSSPESAPCGWACAAPTPALKAGITSDAVAVAWGGN